MAMRRPFRAFATALIVLACARPASAEDAAQLPALHRLGADKGQLYFVGETQSRTYPVFLTAEEAGAPARFHLAYGNAAAVMAEASRISVSINGARVSETAIAAPSGSDQLGLDIDLAAGLLEPGYNAVTIGVTQRHGVDCGIPATYELWTQVDPATTGFRFMGPSGAAIGGLNDVPALPPDADGATPIRIVVSKGMEPARVDQLLRAAQILAIRGHMTHPVVVVEPAPAAAPGLELVAATEGELVAAGLSNLIDHAQPVAVRHGTAPGNVLVVLSGPTAADVNHAVAGIEADPSGPRLPGSELALRAAALTGGMPAAGGSSFTFRDLGAMSQEFSGRLFRTGFDLLMPPDFYPADYDKLTLKIDAGYAAGLDRSNQILVRVNDRDAASLALSDRKGEVFRGRPIAVPLSELRPGFNHIQVEAMLGAAPDAACDARATIDASKRFVLLDSSRLEVPALARIARLPNLAATAASGFPYKEASGGVALYLPHPDANAIAAAGTLLVKAAVAAGRPLPARLAVGRPPDGATSALMVAALDDMPESILDAVGLDGPSLRGTWGRPGPSTGLVAPMSGTAAGTPASDGTLFGDDRRTDMLLQRWSDDVSSNRWNIDPVAVMVGALKRLVGVSLDGLSFWSDDEPRYVAPSDARLVVTQHEAPGHTGATWTVVLAPSGERLESGMRVLTSPSVWTALDGRAAALSGRDDTLSVSPARIGYFIATAPLRPGNLRLIAAGWLSTHVGTYLGCFLILSLGLGLVTAAVIRRSGVQL